MTVTDRAPGCVRPAPTRRAAPTMERYIETIPEVMLAYEEMKRIGKYNIFDSYPIVAEMNRRMAGRAFIDTFQFQAMVLRFMDNPDHYRRSLETAKRRLAATTASATDTATAAAPSTIEAV